MIAIRGAASEIALRLLPLLPADEMVVVVPRGEIPPIAGDRYLFCQGLLRAKPACLQTEAEIDEGLQVNLHQIIRACDQILAGNPRARICVIGSESGCTGSFDETYASAKGLLHRYVETRRLAYPGQQLVCVAPSIIENAGMTVRRQDRDNLDRRKALHPKRRFLDAGEVARLVKFLLYEDRGYITGTVIRMHGGEAAWRT